MHQFQGNSHSWEVYAPTDSDFFKGAGEVIGLKSFNSWLSLKYPRRASGRPHSQAICPHDISLSLSLLMTWLSASLRQQKPAGSLVFFFLMVKSYTITHLIHFKYTAVLTTHTLLCKTSPEYLHLGKTTTPTEQQLPTPPSPGSHSTSCF